VVAVAVAVQLLQNLVMATGEAVMEEAVMEDL
jgi:hypothetical protein